MNGRPGGLNLAVGIPMFGANSECGETVLPNPGRAFGAVVTCPCVFRDLFLFFFPGRAVRLFFAAVKLLEVRPAVRVEVGAAVGAQDHALRPPAGLQFSLRPCWPERQGDPPAKIIPAAFRPCLRITFVLRLSRARPGSCRPGMLKLHFFVLKNPEIFRSTTRQTLVLRPRAPGYSRAAVT